MPPRKTGIVMLTNRYADSLSDTEAVMIAKAGPLETWMNMYTLESEIFVEIPVRNGRLSGVLVQIQAVPLSEDRPLSSLLPTSSAEERPLPPNPLSRLAFFLYLVAILVAAGYEFWSGYILLRRLLSWLS
jgi:hypothetical protein